MAQSIKKRVFAGVAYTTLEKGVIQVLSLVTFVIVANQLSLKDFGLLHLLFSVVNPGTALALFGIDRLAVSDMAAMRARGQWGRIRRFVREYALSAFAVALALFALAWALRSFLDSFYEADLTMFYFALVVFVLCQAVMNFTSVVFEAHERFDVSFYTKALEAAARLLFVASLFWWVGFSLTSVLWAYIGAKLVTALVSAAFLPFCLTRGGADDSGVESPLREILRKHGKWEMVSSFFLTVSDSLTPWLVNFFVSAEGVALFAFTQKVNSMLTGLMPVRSALFPILVHSITENRERAVVIASKMKKYLFLLYGAVYIAVFLSINQVILLFVAQYEGAGDLVRLAMLRLFIDVFTLGQSTVFYALKQQRLTFALSIVSAVQNVIFQVAFTYLWGVEGLVASWLLVSLLNGLIREYFLIAKLKYSLLNWKAIFVFDDLDRRVITMIAERIFRRTQAKKAVPEEI